MSLTFLIWSASSVAMVWKFARLLLNEVVDPARRRLLAVLLVAMMLNLTACMSMIYRISHVSQTIYIDEPDRLGGSGQMSVSRRATSGASLRTDWKQLRQPAPGQLQHLFDPRATNEAG